MKILIVTFSFPPQVGGVAEVARTQARGFAARGHQVTVATVADSERTEAHCPDGVTLREFQISGNFLAGQGYRGDVAEYQEFIAREPFDIILIHCWQNWGPDLAAPMFGGTRAKKILLSHGFDAQVWRPQARFPWGLGVWLRSLPYVWRLPRLMKTFDRLVFLSGRCDGGRFFDHGLAKRFCPERISIIPNGTHRQEFSRTRENFREAHGIETKYLLLNVANYCDRKNQSATVQDFLTANRADATLVFIGGEFNEYQTALARAYAAGRLRHPSARVLFLEKVPKEMIYAAYQAADAFILSAKQETQPLAILDAMAAGVPFISTNVGCVRDFAGGLVVPSGVETTQAMGRLLDDAALRQRLGAEGRAACELTYDWERVLDAYEALFVRLRK